MARRSAEIAGRLAAALDAEAKAGVLSLACGEASIGVAVVAAELRGHHAAILSLHLSSLNLGGRLHHVLLSGEPPLAASGCCQVSHLFAWCCCQVSSLLLPLARGHAGAARLTCNQTMPPYACNQTMPPYT